MNVHNAARSYFDSVAQQLCQLIGCSAGLLVIDCPVPELRHVLLSFFPSRPPERMYGAHQLGALLGDEQVRAACDFACLRAETQYLLLDGQHESIQHLAITPLSCAGGILGYFLLAHSTEFTPGEDALARDFIDDILPEIETAMRGWVLAAMHRGVHCNQADRVGDVQSELPGMFGSIAMVSHELRSPLAAIKGYAGLLQAYGVADLQQETVLDGKLAAQPILTPARQQRYLDLIMDETRRLEELIADLLDASRLQSGRFALRFTAVNVAEACERVAQRARQQIERMHQAKLRLECAIGSQLPLIRADSHRLEHILSNLLDNAIKYSPQGGTIELRAEAPSLPPRIVRIVVRDQGIGIPESQLSQLYLPFSRLEHPRIRQIPGVGLGLYITRQLVEAMQGTIQINSRVGIGTVVAVNFPVSS